MSEIKNYEETLNKAGILWEYKPKIALLEVSVDKIAASQIRLDGKLHEPSVTDYTIGIKRGDIFPAIVLALPVSKGGRYSIIDGMHRLAAYQNAGVTDCDAYIVMTDDISIIRDLRWMTNRILNGRQESPERVMQVAIDLVNKGRTIKAAADWLRVPPRRIQEYMIGQKIVRVLLAWKVKDIDKLPLSKILLLNRLDPKFQASVGSLAIRASLSHEDMKTVTTTIRNAESDAKRDECMDHFAKIYKTRITILRLGNGNAPRKSMLKLPSILNSVESYFDVGTHLLSLQDLTRIAERCRDSARDLIKLAKRLEAEVKEMESVAA